MQLLYTHGAPDTLIATFRATRPFFFLLPPAGASEQEEEEDEG